MAGTRLLLMTALAAVCGNAKPAEPGKANPTAGFRPFLAHVFLDAKGHRVRLEGTVVLRSGPPLELLACLVGTKEHESIIALRGKPKHMQLALIAAGLKPGHPVRFEPFQPPEGPRVRITVWWRDKTGWRREDARRWVRRIDKPTETLAVDWVFAGSGFYTDPQSGEKHFMADSGDIVSLVNFTDAMFDVPMRSSSSDAELTFESNTPLIPREGTRVYLIVQPAPPPATQPTPK